MIRSSRNQPLPLAIRMDMTPLIDIVFLLLIFFMLTSSFVFQPGVKVHLPKTVTADVAHKENLVITISKKGSLYLAAEVVTLQELEARLAQAKNKQRPVLLRADRESVLGRVVEIWDLCRALGFQQVNIATSGAGDNFNQKR